MIVKNEKDYFYTLHSCLLVAIYYSNRVFNEALLD